MPKRIEGIANMNNIIPSSRACRLKATAEQTTSPALTKNDAYLSPSVFIYYSKDFKFSGTHTMLQRAAEESSYTPAPHVNVKQATGNVMVTGAVNAGTFARLAAKPAAVTPISHKCGLQC